METDVEELGEVSNKHISYISSVNAAAREQEGDWGGQHVGQ
jgi:hypothetical protein